MQTVLLFFASIVLSSFTSTFYRLFGKAKSVNPSDPARLTTIWMGLLSIVYLVLNLLFFKSLVVIDWGVFACAALSGVSFATAAFFYLQAMGCGPFTASAFIMNFSTFISMILSVLFLGDAYTWVQAVGVLIMIGVIYTMSTAGSVQGEHRKPNIKWVIYITLAALTNSMIMFGIKLLQHYRPANRYFDFFLYMYLIGAVVSFAISLISSSVYKGTEKTPAKIYIIPALGLAFCLGLNMLPQYLLPKMVSAVMQFPIGSGGALILTGILGVAMFHEKPTKRFLIASVAGLIAILLLSFGAPA